MIYLVNKHGRRLFKMGSKAKNVIKNVKRPVSLRWKHADGNPGSAEYGVSDNSTVTRSEQPFATKPTQWGLMT